MTLKHNKNTAQYSLKNRNDFFEFKDLERFKYCNAGSRKYNKFLNEKNPEKEKEEGNDDLIFLPELLAALQETIKVFVESFLPVHYVVLSIHLSLYFLILLRNSLFLSIFVLPTNTVMGD